MTVFLDLINVDTPIKRYILAPFARTQMSTDRLYVKQADIYLAFRVQLASKFIVLVLVGHAPHTYYTRQPAPPSTPPASVLIRA